MKKNLLLLVLFGLIQVNCFSQLTVTNNSAATALAQTIAGNGVTVSNATINCNSAASGTFSYAGSNLGLTNGIVLSTGLASDAVYSGTSATVGTDFSSSFTDPNLTNISTDATNDVCLVAFDFVPICNSLSITFVFASNEYPTFVNSVNDAFGIFLTGSNPGGGTYSGTNIATLPNGTPVSINNVNNVTPTNPQYYHDNNTTPNNQIAYHGYTIPITSVTSVVPCSSYHMEIAIADASDGIYDSGVFIQGNSVSCSNTPTVTTSAVGATCGTLGSASVTVTNYTGTPTYQWLPGNQTTSSISNLTPGTYTCLVGLQSGCGTITQTVTTTVTSSGANFTYSVTPQNPSCNNGSNGSASVAVSGGSAPYTYTWTTTPAQNTATATGLSAGTYSVNIKDNTGCIGTTTVTLVNPPPIIATVTTTSTTCSGFTGTATASVTSGGVAPYTYTWTTTPTQAGQTINNLAQGSYSVIISDANTCTTTATGVVGGQGFTWSLSASATNPKCVGSADGSATVTVTNPGASTFTYSWTTIPAQTTSITTPSLTAGSYTVSVTDNNGCISKSSVTLIDPAPITATVNTSPTICTGSTGSATVSVLSGGIAPFTYIWLTNPVQTSSVAVNLAQASYSVVVSDANGCSTVPSGSVQSTGFTWSPVVTSSPTKCYGTNDGTATVTINNSPAGNNYAYIWQPSAQTNTVATNLSIGIYSVTVTDLNGCVSSASVMVTQPTQIILSTQTTPAICTAANGTAIVLASGGTGTYSVNWATNPAQNSTTAINLSQGQYNVTVTDANNCTAITTASVSNTNDLTVTASQSPDLCSKGVGKAMANPKGQAPYAYIWHTNPIDTSQTIDSLHVGTYSVTVTDAFGCVGTAATTVINHNDVLAAQFAITPSGVINAEDPITINLTTNSGWNKDTAYLSNGVYMDKNPFPYTFSQYGNYTATYYFTSINGCKDTLVYDIVVKDYITLYIPNAFSPNGDGRNDYFEAKGTFIDSFEMYIYDRWGILIKKIDNITTVWDGTKSGSIAPEDTYVYKGTASDIFGKHVSFHGQITLIR